MSENKEKNAQEVFATLCEALDALDFKYTIDDEKKRVIFGVKGDDLPMDFAITVDEKRQLVRLASLLPFNFKEERRIEGAIVTSYANYLLRDGSFDYDFRDGEVGFRLTSSFRDSMIGAKMLEYMIHVSIFTVDTYNDKFFMVNQGVLSVEDFIKGFRE